MNDHPYVAGLVVMTIGAFLIIGSITGNLAPMLAAIFDRNDLTTPGGGGGSTGGSGGGGTVGSGAGVPGIIGGTKPQAA